MLRALAEGFPGDEWRAFVPGTAPLTGGNAAGAADRSGGGVRGGGGLEIVRHRLPSRALFGAAAVSGWPRVDELAGGGADVVWLPAPAPAAVSPEVPYVLTLHDLTWIERPGDFTRYERVWHRLGRLERQAERAAAVVCVSEATRAAALRLWPRLDPARVRVVHPGVEDVADDGAAPPPGLPQRFVLHVGALEPRKDPLLLAEAFARARARGLDADLVFAGEGRLAEGLRGREGVHVLGRVGATGALYARALALAMPTRLEGFGLPPLEAALHGTPSVVSDLPVFAETLGDAALRAPVGDVDAWAEALLTVGRVDRLRREVAERAAGRARAFTWDRAAAGLHAVLREAAGARA